MEETAGRRIECLVGGVGFHTSLIIIRIGDSALVSATRRSGRPSGRNEGRKGKKRLGLKPNRSDGKHYGACRLAGCSPVKRRNGRVSPAELCDRKVKVESRSWEATVTSPYIHPYMYVHRHHRFGRKPLKMVVHTYVQN